VHRIRTKICGLTRNADAMLAAELGADAIGLVFYPPSKRSLKPTQAREVVAGLPAFVSRVALFVDPDADAVNEVLASLHVDCLQFHGSETADFCASFGVPYMKALRMRPGVDALASINGYPDASAILLDAYEAGMAGGTGKRFDWALAVECVQRSSVAIVLAGGLSADNLEQAMTQVCPWALDVSSGVEAQPGIKDAALMQQFFNEVYRVQSKSGF